MINLDPHIEQNDKEERKNEKLPNHEEEKLKNSGRVEEEMEEKMCRICRGTEEPLYHPCKCKGSIKYVHETCLKNWFKSNNSTKCELCHHKIKFVQEKKDESVLKLSILITKMSILILLHSLIPFVSIFGIGSIGFIWAAFFEIEYSWFKIFDDMDSNLDYIFNLLLLSIYYFAIGSLIAIFFIILFLLLMVFKESLTSHPEVLEPWYPKKEEDTVEEENQVEENEEQQPLYSSDEEDENNEEANDEEIRNREALRAELEGQGVDPQFVAEAMGLPVEREMEISFFKKVSTVFGLIGNIIGATFGAHIVLIALVYFPYYLGRHHDYWFDGTELVYVGKDMIKNDLLRTVYYIARGYIVQLISAGIYMVGMYLISFIAPSFKFHEKAKPIIYIVYLFLKYVVAFTLQFIVGPTFIGIGLNMIVGKYFGNELSFSDVLQAIQTLDFPFFFYNFVPGMIAVFILGYTFNTLRRIVNSNVLWFITNSTDPEFEYIHLINCTPPHRIIRSFIAKQLMFIFIELALLRAPLKIISSLGSETIFPISISWKGFFYTIVFDSIIIYMSSHLGDSRKLVKKVFLNSIKFSAIALSILLGVDTYIFPKATLEGYHKTFIDFSKDSLFNRFFANPKFEIIVVYTSKNDDEEIVDSVSPISYTLYLLSLWVLFCIVVVVFYGLPLVVCNTYFPSLKEFSLLYTHIPLFIALLVISLYSLTKHFRLQNLSHDIKKFVVRVLALSQLGLMSIFLARFLSMHLSQPLVMFPDDYSTIKFGSRLHLAIFITSVNKFVRVVDQWTRCASYLLDHWNDISFKYFKDSFFVCLEISFSLMFPYALFYGIYILQYLLVSYFTFLPPLNSNFNEILYISLPFITSFILNFDLIYQEFLEFRRRIDVHLPRDWDAAHVVNFNSDN